MFFGSRHDILELPQIPRERGALQSLINESRHQRRLSRLKRWAAGNYVVWSLFIILFWIPMQNRPAQPAQAVESPRMVYLSIVFAQEQTHDGADSPNTAR